MLASKKDIAINKGNSINLKVQFKNENGEIIVFESGAIIYFTVKENYCNNDFLFQKTSLHGIEYDENSRSYIISIDISDTENLEYKNYVYDIAVVRNKGEGSADLKEKQTILIGNFGVCFVATFAENEVGS